MSVEKRAQRIRQTPKHLEKMLFVNHKEEQGLQRRLENITTDSRVRGRLLDRERIKVRNESRFNSRLNYQNIAPLLDKIPGLIHAKMTTNHAYSVESLNDYILQEYRRNSRVIPSILASLGKELNKGQQPEDEHPTQNGEQSSSSSSSSPNRKQSVSISGFSGNRRGSIKPAPTSNLYNASHNTNSDVLSKSTFYLSTSDSGGNNKISNDLYEGISPRRIANLVKEIAKIRNEMFANKKIDIMRSRVSFPELLRHVQEKDKIGSESDTYTDGTCVLLRRKMQKIRKHTAPDPDLEVYAMLGQCHHHSNDLDSGHNQVAHGVPKVPKKRHSVAQSTFESKVPRLPSISGSKSAAASMTSIARQHILDNDEKELKRQLDEQERQQTEMKVAIETRKYQRIQKRINEFLKEPPKRPALPLLYETEIG